ncbi:MAG: zinc dependent phospholipase C family protein [Proteobacteria bacterium]|nr:zinc dependent phospholipase C family protein [Pseudomonadota bacterium]
MPKEFTHFLIADKALGKAKAENAEAGLCIKENYNLFMLGAILCDSPYYHLPFSGSKGSLLALSKNIHKPCGEIDSDFFQRLAAAITGENMEAYFAFLCGILSHHIADRNFHPFIFYFTGKDSDPSRHRFLESLIDLRLMRVMADKKICRASLADYLSLEKSTMLPCLHMFVKASVPPAMKNETAAITEKLWKALRFEIFLSSLYNNRVILKALIRTNKLLKARFSPFVTLFYPEESSCDLSLLNSEFSYRAPSSGEERDASLASIAEKTAEQLSSAIILAYKNLKDSKPIFDKESINKLFNKRDQEAFELRHSDTKAIDTAMQAFLKIMPQD